MGQEQRSAKTFNLIPIFPNSSSDLQKISSIEYFIMGGTAKAVATVLTYPLQLAQCRLRVCYCTSLFYGNLIHHMATSILLLNLDTNLIHKKEERNVLKPDIK